MFFFSSAASRVAQIIGWEAKVCSLPFFADRTLTMGRRRNGALLAHWRLLLETPSLFSPIDPGTRFFLVLSIAILDWSSHYIGRVRAEGGEGLRTTIYRQFIRSTEGATAHDCNRSIECFLSALKHSVLHSQQLTLGKI